MQPKMFKTPIPTISNCVSNFFAIFYRQQMHSIQCTSKFFVAFHQFYNNFLWRLSNLLFNYVTVIVRPNLLSLFILSKVWKEKITISVLCPHSVCMHIVKFFLREWEMSSSSNVTKFPCFSIYICIGVRKTGLKLVRHTCAYSFSLIEHNEIFPVQTKFSYLSWDINIVICILLLIRWGNQQTCIGNMNQCPSDKWFQVRAFMHLMKQVPILTHREFKWKIYCTIWSSHFICK